ncbi:class I SAM-dependent methyltransferase [bacterium]|nr:class I SAM-dependent methyltransferase [bacterium]
MLPNKTLGYDTQYWLTKEAIQGIEYSEYWNDEQKELQKPCWILDGNFSKMEDYLRDSNLLLQVNESLCFLREKLGRTLHGVGADLASGNCWAIPHLLNANPNIQKIYAVEYSEHRLLKLGASVLSYYGVPKDAVTLCLGSFYDLQILSESLDFVVLSQAFHHAEYPLKLLSEIYRALKPGGIVIITGEPKVEEIKFSLVDYARHTAEYILARLIPKRLLQSRLFSKQSLPYHDTLFLKQPILPFDPILGDHLYYLSEYGNMFRKGQFRYHKIDTNHVEARSFILQK